MTPLQQCRDALAVLRDGTPAHAFGPELRAAIAAADAELSAPPQTPAAWAMEIPGCDGSADWCELGAEEPEPLPPAVASPLYRAPPARRRDGRRGAA